MTSQFRFILYYNTIQQPYSKQQDYIKRDTDENEKNLCSLFSETSTKGGKCNNCHVLVVHIFMLKPELLKVRTVYLGHGETQADISGFYKVTKKQHTQHRK
ncbi:hypothetical protein ACJX0J_011115 [Zea mays]